MVRKYLLIVGCVLGLFTSKTYSQASVTLSIDSINNLNPILIGGITNFEVRVRVNNFLGLDTISGDIFYYYQTDSMMLVSAPPRIFLQDSVIDSIADPFLDTIPIDIQSNEIRTGPLNLIVVWPAMYHPAVLDTDSVVIYRYAEGYLGLEHSSPMANENILYPFPAMQYLFIKPDEIDLIEQIQIMNMQGQVINTLHEESFSNGWVNIDHLKSGTYMVLLRYKNGKVINKKILKE